MKTIGLQKTISGAIGVVMMCLLVLITGIPAIQPVQAAPLAVPAYNSPFITDQDLRNYNGWSLEQIRTFLRQKGSYFKDAVNDVDGVSFEAARVIYDAAQQYHINPAVILATMQKESSTVTRTTRPSDGTMKFMMGCVASTTARQQLTCAAERFNSYQNSLEAGRATVSGWKAGVAKGTQDGVSVTPATSAAAAQFTYTPYAGVDWGGNRAGVGGVALFARMWAEYKTPPVVVQPPTAPSNSRVSANGQTSLVLRWNDDSYNESGFRVYEGNTNISSPGAGATSLIINGLTAGSNHCYTVSAYNAAGESARSGQACGATAPPVATDPDDNRVMASGQTLNGTINPASDWDTYYFDAAAGQLATLTMRKTSGELDSMLFLYKPDGSQLTMDDDGGGGRDSRIQIALPVGGRYKVMGHSYSFGSTGGYALALTLSTLNPTDPDDNRVVASGQTLSGTINPANDADTYYFDAAAGQPATLTMRKTSGGLDSLLYLYKPDGSQLTLDDDGGGGTDSRIQATLPVGGRYKVMGRSFNAGSTGGYALALTLSAPPSTCPSISEWKGEYFNNVNLTGNPVLCRNDGYIDVDWGGGSPGGAVPVDNFSARWTRTLNFEAGSYRFVLGGDDGVRLWVDNNLIINHWVNQGYTEYPLDYPLSAGSHAIRVEYFEGGGGARVKLVWSKNVDCTPNADQVTLFEHGDYGGRCKVLGVGNYPTPETMGFPNDAASSIKVGANVNAVLYQHDNYNGTAETFGGNDSNLSDNAIRNDNVTSMRVMLKNSTSCSPNADQVALYEHGDYGGRCKVLGVGNYPTPEIMGFPNDAASSIKVGANVKAILYQHDNYNGTAEVFSANDSLLGDNAIRNDNVTSVKVMVRGQEVIDVEAARAALRGNRDMQSPWLQINAPLQNNTSGRSASWYAAVIDQFDVASPSFSGRYSYGGAGLSDTRCNIFAGDVMRAMNAPLPKKGDVGHGASGSQWTDRMTANASDINSFLNGRLNSNDAANSGWWAVDATTPSGLSTLIAHVNAGKPAVASTSGHIAVFRPGQGNVSRWQDLLIAQAGGSLFLNGPIADRFGRTPQFFLHN